MGFLTKLETIPSQYRWALIPLPLLIVAVSYWYFLYQPAAQVIENLQQQIVRQTVTLTQYRQVAANYNKFQREVEELEVNLRLALAQLPTSKEIPELIRQISDLGVRTGLQITLLRPQAEEMQEFYAAVPITVKMVGAFHAMGQFFDQLSHLPRIISVNKLKLTTTKTDKKNEAHIETECLATTYRFLDEQEARVSAAASDPTRSRKN
jgi:type IV pilus assembly protein PilO